MTAGTGDQVYGWGEFGGFGMQSGQTIRMGLTWPGDAGPVYLTAACLTIPSTLVRESSVRELKFGPAPYNRSTTEWITVTATSSFGWLSDIVLSYFGTYRADDIIGGEHDIELPPWRYQVVAVKGRVAAWLKARPPLPGQPAPLIGPAFDDHTLHPDIELDTDSADPVEIAERLAGRL